MAIWQLERGKTNSEQGPPIAEVVDWNRQSRSFEEIALTSGTEAAPLSQLGEPEIIHVQYVTPDFFHVLRVQPEFGRIFKASEAQDRAQTVMISDAFWKLHFQGSLQALGKTFDLSGVESTVAGIMPPRFAPFHGERIDVWEPINPASARYSERKDRGWLMPVGRLRDGVSLAQARDEMQVVARRMERAFPTIDNGIDDQVVPLREAVSGWARMLYPFLGAVGFVLLIACLNVANLLQSRTETRRKEQAVRAALGASRRRLIQQLFAESSLLAILGGATGLALTFAGIKLFLKLADGFPNSAEIHVDYRVLLFTLAISAATALLFGIVPSLQSSNPNLNIVLREGDRRTVAGSRRLLRQVLVIAEVALAMVLLTGAGLMIKTVFQMQQGDPGYDPGHVVIASVALAEGGRYVEIMPGSDMQKVTPLVTSFYNRLLDLLAILPGVESVATVSRGFRSSSFAILNHAAPSPEHRPEAAYGEVSADFFRVLKIPLKSGRYINASDTLNSPWVVVINQALARRYFPNENPVGKQLLMRYESYHVDETRTREIVGVVGDAKLDGLEQRVFPTVFSSFRQQAAVFPGGAMLPHIHQTLLVRTRSEVAESDHHFVSSLRKAAAKIDRDQPVTDVMSMQKYLAGSMGDTKFVMQLLEIFAAMALVLAAIGIYGMMSHIVSERTHEIGIRLALGAPRSNVLGLIAKFGLALTLTGLAIGAGLAMALTRTITQFLSGVSPTDPLTFAAVALVLLLVALLACYLPANRATRVDPMAALRNE